MVIVDVSSRVWLAMAVHALWPSYDVAHVAAVAARAADVARDTGIPAEVLIAISQHESDLEPRACTWVDGRHHRHDVVLRDDQAPRGCSVYGYLQAMCADPATCAHEMDVDGGMRAGAAELVEWLATCRGDIACALRGHAGGTRCALDARACTAPQRAFARMFIERAADLSRLEDSTPTEEP